MARLLPIVSIGLLALTLLHVFLSVGRVHDEPARTASPPPPLPLVAAIASSSPPPSPAASSSSPPPLPAAAAAAGSAPRRGSSHEASSQHHEAGSQHDIVSSAVAPAACLSKRLRTLLSPACGTDVAAMAADEAADAKTLEAALRAHQHPSDCARRRIVLFKDWRNGLGAQLSSLVGAWSAQLGKPPSLLAPAALEAAAAGGTSEPLPVLLVPSGGLRYANKAQCPKRDLSCYFEPFASCAAPEGVKKVRAAKMAEELAAQWSGTLRLRRARDKWWVRKEMMRYIFRPNRATRAMVDIVRREMELRPPADRGGGEDATATEGAASEASEAAGSTERLRSSDLVAIHVRRGDKRDLGAKERGEPFTDAMCAPPPPPSPPPPLPPLSHRHRQSLSVTVTTAALSPCLRACRYVQGALALADEVGARGFLLASSEPETLRRLPALLAPRPTYVMPAKYFVQVPEGLTPHQVVEKTRQEGGANDEGRSQIVQLLLLAEARAFLGTVTSNFGLLVTKLMAFAEPTPVAIDLSCAGLTAMRAATDDSPDVWPLWDAAPEGMLAAGCREKNKKPRRIKH